ncbi:hypothetical protein [Treponema sp.]|uniref:hypothetical protein n=1 Tax=Treponema sp. TaxID=166 RepID=UPI0025FF9509|nr:hypothetical protein [Treponema sp.]MCR5218610.1 hypothetical protein [Treponema sp.]
MTETELKEEMDKDLGEIFNVENIINFQFDLMQKAYLKGIGTGRKINLQIIADLEKTCELQNKIQKELLKEKDEEIRKLKETIDEYASELQEREHD